MKNFQQSETLQKLPKQFFASLVAKVNNVVAQGHDVINLGQGNPDQPTPQHIVEALKKAADQPKFHKYSPFRGHTFLKKAAAEFYQREYGVELDPETEIAILFGGKAGLVEIPQCLLNPGDVALVPDPGYPDYWSGVELARAEMAYMPLKEENYFLPDYTEIDSEKLEKAKVMFLNYPNNPTGAIATKEFLKIQFLFRKNIIFVWYMILHMVRLDMRGKSRSAFWKLKVPKISVLKYTHFQKPIIWQAGEWALRLETQV